jgi:hypothetical protein
MPSRIWGIAVIICLSLTGCENPVEPGMEWVVGSWRLALRCSSWSCTPDSSAQVLTLESDGSVVVREDGNVALRTGFRARRDQSVAGLEYALWFNHRIAGATRHPIPAERADTLVLGSSLLRGCDVLSLCHVFVRLP